MITLAIISGVTSACLYAERRNYLAALFLSLALWGLILNLVV